MRRIETTFYTGQQSDGSDRVEHLRVQWIERYAGQDYVVQEQVDPPTQRGPDRAIIRVYAPDPSEAAVLEALAKADLVAAQTQAENARIEGLQASWAAADTTLKRLDVLGKALKLSV